MPPVLISKSSSVYLLSFIIFATGIWLILKFGSTLLHAREDLAGEWVLTPLPSTHLTGRMQVEQSGQYFNITFPDSRPLNLVMTNEKIVQGSSGEHKQITLAGDGETLEFEGNTGGDLWRLICSGTVQGEWVARLADRTYPKPEKIQKSTTQPTTREPDAR